MNATRSASAPEPPPPLPTASPSSSSSSGSAGTPVYIWVITALGVLVLVVVFRLVRYGALWGGHTTTSSLRSRSRGSGLNKSSQSSCSSSSRRQRRGSSASPALRSNSTDPLAASSFSSASNQHYPAAPAAVQGNAPATSTSADAAAQPHISTFDDPSAPVASAVLNIQSLMRTFTPRHIPAQDGGLPLAVPRKVEYRSPSEVELNDQEVESANGESQELGAPAAAAPGGGERRGSNAPPSVSNLIHAPVVPKGALAPSPTPAQLPLAVSPPKRHATPPNPAPPSTSSTSPPTAATGMRPPAKVITVPNAPPMSNQLTLKPSTTSLRPGPPGPTASATSPVFRPAPDPVPTASSSGASAAGLTTLTTVDEDTTTSIKRPLKAFTPTHYVIRSGGQAMTVDRPPPSAVLPSIKSKSFAVAAATANKPATTSAPAPRLPNPVPPPLPAPVAPPAPAHGAPPVAIPVSAGAAAAAAAGGQPTALVPVVYYVAAAEAASLPPGGVVMGTPVQVVMAAHTGVRAAQQPQRGRR